MRLPVLAAFLLMVATAIGTASAEERLKVGVFDHPPFAQKDEDGQWTGLAIDLWERVATEMERPFEYVETTLEDAVEDTVSGRVDVVAGALGVSAERERRVDFTQPFLSTSTAVALTKTTRLPHWFEFLHDLLGHGLLSIVLLLVGTLGVFSLLLWLVERRSNHAHFGGKPIHGFGSALWFAAVTMTTVGYGDKTPRTAPGRILAFVWMFIGVFIVGIFTATLASSIAISRTQTSITRVSDLAPYRNGVVDGSLAQRLLVSAGIRAQTFNSIEEGLEALKAGSITAFVDLEISLRYVVNENHAGEMFIESLPSNHVGMAFAVKQGMNLIEPINIALIEATSGPEWSREIERWVGPPAR